jgi:adhesin transport system outer membrane protein
MIQKTSRWMRLGGAALAIGLSMPAMAQSRCINEDTQRMEGVVQPYVDPAGPRAALQTMIREARTRSQQIGASRLLAEAAALDVKEVRASGWPQVGLSGSLGYVGSRAPDTEDVNGSQGRATLSITAPLYDGGRINRLTDWKANLAEAARFGQISTDEQVVLQTVSLAIERSRYRMQVQVYQQYARKMGCLVEALETIVRSDKGRTSELVQAQKTLQQAEIAQAQTVSMVRQVEIRLRRFVGDGLPSPEGMGSILLDLPPLNDFLVQAESSAEIAQLGAQAEAADSYAKSVDALKKPQLSWVITGSKAQGAGNSTSMLAGVNVNIPLFAPGTYYASDAAVKRAEAARLQRADALESRRARMADVHEQATAAFDRARRVISVLRDSDRVRNYTLQQWQQLGKRSLFDVMSAESDHYQMRVAYVNALYDGEQSNALLRSLGLGVANWLE